MDIKELHDHLFDILCVIDSICSKEKVRWFLDSGTEIGAIREGDFIAWDDDMDIKVLSEDYSAFRETMRRNLPPYMKLIEPDDLMPAFYDFAVRIIDERYPLNKQTEDDLYYSNYTNYVGTDVFVFSKAPNTALRRKITVVYNKILYGLGMAHRYKIDYDSYKGIQRLQVKVLSGVGRLIPLTKVLEWKRRDLFRNNHITSSFRFSSTYTLHHLEFFPEKYYNQTVFFPIRNRPFPVPVGYDDELRQIYGNYMVPEKDTQKYNQHLRDDL